MSNQSYDQWCILLGLLLLIFGFPLNYNIISVNPNEAGLLQFSPSFYQPISFCHRAVANSNQSVSTLPWDGFDIATNIYLIVYCNCKGLLCQEITLVGYET